MACIRGTEALPLEALPQSERARHGRSNTHTDAGVSHTDARESHTDAGVRSVWSKPLSLRRVGAAGFSAPSVGDHTPQVSKTRAVCVPGGV